MRQDIAALDARLARAKPQGDARLALAKPAKGDTATADAAHEGAH
jgi:NADH-quinone oxidoreductase subunit M